MIRVILGALLISTCVITCVLIIPVPNTEPLPPNVVGVLDVTYSMDSTIIRHISGSTVLKGHVNCPVPFPRAPIHVHYVKIENNSMTRHIRNESWMTTGRALYNKLFGE